MTNPTPNSANELIKSLYKNQNKVIVLGVTGYTGSGCKSVSNIFRHGSYLDCSESDIYHRDKFDQIKFNSAIQFLNSTDNKVKFRAIKISHIILCACFFSNENILEECFDLAFRYIGIVDTKERKYIKDCFLLVKAKFFEKLNSRTVYKKLIDFLIFDEIRLDKTVQSLNDIEDSDSFQNDFSSFFKAIDDLKSELCDKYNRYPYLYTVLFQRIGFVIRKSTPLSHENKTAYTDYQSIPIIVYKIVNIYRLMDESESQSPDDVSTCVVIETIRNNLEIGILRERFQNFYMISVHRDESERISSMGSGNDFVESYIGSYEKGKIIPLKNGCRIDDKENIAESIRVDWYSKEERTSAKEFWVSDVSKCIQSSDIHIFNDKKSDGFDNLKAQICWYLSLIMHPGLFPPRDEERVMNIAFQQKLASGCISRQVGAVVTDRNYTILSVGCNDVPRGQTSCVLRSVEGCLNCQSNDKSYSEYEKVSRNVIGSFRESLVKYYQAVGNLSNSDNTFSKEVETRETGVPLGYCFKDVHNFSTKDINQVHTRAVHAEENALIQVGKAGLSEGAKLFTTSSTCELCAKKAAEMGVSEIHFVDPYTGLASKHNLRYYNSPALKQFYGAVGLGYYKMYVPKVVRKEELELLYGPYRG